MREKKGLRRRSSRKIRGEKCRPTRRGVGLFILKTTVVLIFIAILGWGIHSLLLVSRSIQEFSIKNVCVLGDYPDKGEIRERFDRYCLKEFGKKSPNILELDLNDLKRYIETIPRVEEARIRRQFPETIFIEVKQRRPLALIPNGDSILGCDRTNTFELDQPFRYDLPFITGLKGIEVEKINGARKIIFEMNQTVPTILPMISEINVSDSENLSLYTTKGTRIYFGNVDNNLSEKLVKLKGILDYSERTRLVGEYVDLRFKRAVIKPRG